MPLPKVPSAWDQKTASISADEVRFADVQVIEIPVIHELGFDQNGGIIETTRLIKPSRRLTVVKVESQVVTRGFQGISSPPYMATVRRRNRPRATGSMVLGACG